MKQVHFLVFALVTSESIAMAGAQAQPILNPANGHFYEAITADNLDWSVARDDAASLTFNGWTGYLATITSQSEDDFILSNFPQAARDGFWLGGYQIPGSIEPAGGWAWVTGERWAYTNWAPGEPNNRNGLENEDALHFTNASDPSHNHTPGQWNDLRGTGPDLRFYVVGGYVVEYSAPVASVPEPASLAMLLVGFLPLGLVARRRCARRGAGPGAVGTVGKNQVLHVPVTTRETASD
jgi:hypothetical protein